MIADRCGVGTALVKTVAEEYHIKHRATAKQVQKIEQVCKWISDLKDDLIGAFDYKADEAEKEALEDWIILRGEGYDSITEGK